MEVLDDELCPCSCTNGDQNQGTRGSIPTFPPLTRSVIVFKLDFILSLDSSNIALDLALIPMDAKGRRPPLDQPIHGFFLLSCVFSFPGNLLLAP